MLNHHSLGDLFNEIGLVVFPGIKILQKEVLVGNRYFRIAVRAVHEPKRNGWCWPFSSQLTLQALKVEIMPTGQPDTRSRFDTLNIANPTVFLSFRGITGQTRDDIVPHPEVGMSTSQNNFRGEFPLRSALQVIADVLMGLWFGEIQGWNDRLAIAANAALSQSKKSMG